MNLNNLEIMFRNYINNFGYFEDPNGGHESYKWTATEQVQKVWDLGAKDLSGMIKSAFSKTVNLINNRIVSPGNGLVLLAKEEPEAVRKALENLLAETEDVDELQDRILQFVDEINALLEKHFPGKWKYEHDVRVAITYLALIIPSRNYLFKSSVAHYFARYMEYDTDIGSGRNFKLKHYYRMCDELLEIVKNQPELLAKNEERKVAWQDKSLHLLVTDLMYCFAVYPFMREGINAPAPRKTSRNSNASLLERERKAAELQQKLLSLQDDIDAVEAEIAALPAIDLAGKTIRTKLYGNVVIEKQTDHYLTFTAEGKEREFALPGCITNGFLIPEDPEIMERCKKEAKMLEKLKQLNSEQRLTNIEFRKY